MESTHTPYIGSGQFAYEFVAGRPSAGTIYVFLFYRNHSLTGIYKSTDYGETWDQFMTLDTMTGGDSDYDNFSFNPKTWDLGMTASDSHVFVAIRNGTSAMGIWRIPHAGGSATKIHTGPTGSNAGKCSARIAADANGNVVQGMYSTSTFFDPVMAWSNDDGDNWTELKHLSGNTIEGVQRVIWYAIDGAEVLVMYNTALREGLWRTTDANNGTGCTWTEILFGLGSPAGRCSSRFDIRFSSLAISAFITASGKVVVSDDYVTADAYVTDLISTAGGADTVSNYPRAYHPSDDKLYAIDDESKVWELNGTHPPTAATQVGTLPVWFGRRPGYAGQNNGWLQFDLNDEDVMYVLNNWSGLLRSADGGVNWYAKGALPTDYNGDPKYHIKDLMTDTNGTALASHTPDIDFAGGGWTEEAGAIEIQDGMAVESTPGSESVGLIDLDLSAQLMGSYFCMADIEPADPMDVVLFLRYQDSTHYLKLRLYSSGGDLLTEFIYNNGGGEVVYTGPYTVGTMPTLKFRVVALYVDATKFYAFSVKLALGAAYEKGGTAGRPTFFSSEATIGFGFGATDAGSEIGEFHIIEPHSVFADHWWVGDAADSIDSRVAGNYYSTDGGASPGTQVPGQTWDTTDGTVQKLVTRSIAASSPGGGTEGRAIVEDIGVADLFIDAFQFDPWNSASQFACLLFRVQDGDNHLMIGVESLSFKVWKVVGGTPTVLATESHVFSSSGHAYMYAWALGKHICVFGVKSGETPEIVFDDNETTFQEETGLGVYSGPNIVPASNEIHTTGLIKKTTLSEFVKPDGIYVEVAGTEIQTKCLSARTERGRDEELGQAQTGIAELTCDNSDGDFSPENSGGAYYGTLDLGASLVVYEIYLGVIYYHFTGKIDKILPHAEWDNRVAYIVGLDGMDDLAGTEIKTVLRTDTETGELCGDVLDAISWPSGAANRDLDTGIDVLQYGWFHKVKGLQGIRMLEQIEKGFFYIDVDGKAIWENRHHRLSGAHLTPQADFEDTMVEVGYEYTKRQIRNQVTVKGRRYFSGGVTLWSGYDLATLDDDLIWSAHCGDVQAPYIPQATTVTLWAEWNEALASHTALVKGTHWDANTQPDKSGTDVGANITITETAYGQAIKLEIANAGSVGAYIVEPDSPPLGAPADRTLLIYGILFGAENISITKEDSTSQTAYGVRSLDIDAPFKSNPNDIRALAEYLLARFKDPVPDAVSVRLVARTNSTIRVECLQRKISDRITLKATLHGFDRDFFINKVIQDYVLKEGGFQHETTWMVERAEGAYEHLFWLLGTVGFGELGEATYLGV